MPMCALFGYDVILNRPLTLLGFFGIHRRRTQVWSVEVILHRAKRDGKNFAALCAAANFLKVCTFRLPFFKGISFQTFPTVQQNIWKTVRLYVLTLSSFPGDRPAASSLEVVSVKKCISLIPTHLDCFMVYFKQKYTRNCIRD